MPPGSVLCHDSSGMPRRSWPRLDGSLALDGLEAPVTVYRDAHGIPQLYARTALDLFRAQGYVHA